MASRASLHARALARKCGPLLALCAGCTRLLEIDGDYTFAPGVGIDKDASQGGTGGRHAPDSGVSTGNAPSHDASTTPSEDAAIADGAAAEPDAPRSDCLPGLYEGTLDGVHSPSFTIVAVPLPLSATVSMRLESVAADRLRFEDAVFEGGLSGTTLQAFSGSLEGEVNCITLEIENGRLEGLLAAIPVSGTLRGQLLGTQLTATWEETEPDPQFSGEGTATLTRTSP